MRIIPLLLITFISLVENVNAVSGDMECGTAMACFPWAGRDASVPCVRGRRINLRFILDSAKTDVTTESGANASIVYGFCPIVDRLQIFSLTQAPYLMSIINVEDIPTLTQDIGEKYISVYGFGMSNNTIEPQKGVSAGAVMAAVNGSSLCGSYHSVALVHTLILDIGLHRGLFNYIGAREASEAPIQQLQSEQHGGESNNNNNNNNNVNSDSDNHETNIISEVVVQPAMVGFSPTCNEKDECMFDKNSVCVGKEVGKKNCATCYNNPESIKDAPLQVWTSYYGTDYNGYPMRSSGLNPLNYKQFAANTLFRDMARTFNNIRDWNIDPLA